MADLPPFLEDQDEDTIHARILARFVELAPGVDVSEGSAAWDLTRPWAVELARTVDTVARETLRRRFIATSYGVYLELIGEEMGAPKRAAVQATGEVTFSGVNSTVVPALTVVRTPTVAGTPSQAYTTDAEVTISGGTATAAVTAVLGGVAGNAGAGTIIILGTAVPGVTGVTNASPTTGGVDIEDEEVYRARLLRRAQRISTGGNPDDYTNWAEEVQGVGLAKTIPIWDGPGTVQVLIVDETRTAAAGALVTAVQDYIDAKRLIGHDVTVAAPSFIEIDVAASLTIAAGYDRGDVEDAVEAAIADYLASLAFNERYDASVSNDVRYAVIVATIASVEGVQDVASVTVEAGTSDVAIAEDEVAIPGDYTWT